MGDIDPAFIQSTEHRPKAKVVEVCEIPVIDLSEGRKELLISQIGKACEEWGFFQVINHGVPFEISREVEIEAKKFFEMSLEEKKKLKRDEFNAMGYHDGEHTKNVRDWKEVFDYLVENTAEVPSSHEPNDMDLRILTNQWPQNSPRFRETLQEYAREVEKLAYKLLELISLSLGLDAEKFHGCFMNQLSMVRLNYYPTCPFPDLALGVGRHKDSSALTVLAQDDVGGLQVKRKSDGEWIPVKPTPNAFIINVGDIVQDNVGGTFAGLEQ
ncbi:protein DOWNY MILDEW RESISTANCE 6-like isoform X2 [Glycine soja]|uniref:Fe2OG dioxygenase domain-containing protein n=1 Tax=Glycine max TaxID=3847 RepID=K7L2G9_SOYBN|nr:protein DOWNY MILDEW RESISTANCE 6 isoform X2 [Glycine max]XP_028240842.1 protein DOWNY MILDEW RESISTANCE 6-like isoform X2 [Glycine soja]|eukprot:XP_014633581.1 protein DOWNY MILDEW RESISTANCE 6 isoform X2 [Glycine max]